MDPYTEQRLREEVMYLHSLWHQGPPSNPNPNYTNPNPNQRIAHHCNPNYRNAHHSNHSTQLKPVNKMMKQRGKKKGKKLPPLLDFEWPCNEISVAPSSSSGWPIFNPAKTKPVRLPTAEEQTHLDAIRIQQKAVKASQQFFTGNKDSDDDIDSNDSEDEDEDDNMMDEDGNAPYNLFIKLFEEDGELRGYYEKNNENGEFSCLVCGGVWEKVGKRFKNCVALVQHSVTIAKTKNKKAHRAYSQVICKVLGWDIKRLPSMPLSLDKQPDESKGHAEVAGDSLTSNNKDSMVDKDSDVDENEELPSSIIPETSTGDNVMPCEGNVIDSTGNISISNIDIVPSNVGNGESNLYLKEKDIGQFLDVEHLIMPGITDNVNGDVMLCESSLKVDDADKFVDNIETGVSNTDGNLSGVSNTDGNSSGVVNHLCRNVAQMTVLEER